jgi:hypothetical protein
MNRARPDRALPSRALNHAAVPNRRDFLFQSAGATAGLLAFGAVHSVHAADSQPLKVACIMTAFHHRSHAHVILENFLHPYLFNGQVTQPGMQVASFFVDQYHPEDMTRETSKQYGIPIYKTIGEAVTLGGDKLAVDAVMIIGEHGDYPVNAKGQMEYPRKKFFDEVVAVFKKSGRGVPVFNDKHLSYRWDWAKEMVDTSHSLDFPLMAGSSVPLAQRRPPMEFPSGAKIDEAVSIQGGGVESYDFHCLEVLQSQVEARQGGETGVAKVQFLDTPAMWKAAAEGFWSPDLAAAAMAAEVGPDDPMTKYLASGGKDTGAEAPPTHAIAVHYKDGLRGLALKVGNSATRWNFATRLPGDPKPLATAYYVGPWQNRNLFKALSHAIQTFFREKKAPYPIERTLLTTGTLDAAMDSRVAGGKLTDTPQLEFSYAPVDFRRMREMGDSWKIITEEMPEHEGIKPVGV